MADAIFEDPRLAEIYDPLDPDRSDLIPYVDLAVACGARSVLDIGCGTGTFACLLAEQGIDVVALDPAAASLEVARRKNGAGRVRWIHGGVAALPPLGVDLVTMTANVAQVFLSDEDWEQTLAAAYAALRPGGLLVFESRDPAQSAWVSWNEADSKQVTDVPGIGRVDHWVELIDVRGDLVAFRSEFAFRADGTRATSHSTLRFRRRDELISSVDAAGFELREIREAPDRPGREIVVIAHRPAPTIGP